MNSLLFGQSGEYHFGPNGFDLVAGPASAATTGSWYKIEPTNGSVVISGTSGSHGHTNLSGQTIDKAVFGRFTSLQVVSGTLIAYKL